MRFLDLAPDLLGDEAVVRKAPGHGAQLEHVDRVAQIHFGVPANLVRERHDTLRLEP